MIGVGVGQSWVPGTDSIADLEGAMLIIGSSLADNDSHIFEKVNDSRIEKIYIASCEKDKMMTFQKQ